MQVEFTHRNVDGSSVKLFWKCGEKGGCFKYDRNVLSDYEAIEEVKRTHSDDKKTNDVAEEKTVEVVESKKKTPKIKN